MQAKFGTKRFLAAIILLCVVVTVLFSAFFGLTHTDHQCIGEDCLVCAGIQFCENILKVLSSGGIAVIFACLFALLLSAVLPDFGYVSSREGSLISHKIRLNI